MFKWIGVVFLVVLLGLGVLGEVSGRVDARLNHVVPEGAGAPIVSAKASKRLDGLYMADLHSDMLLWRRDPRMRHGHGHTDLPRLASGGVDLQVFSAVTASPEGQNFDANTLEGGDRITLLSLAQGQPVATWLSMRARAVHQAERLAGLERAGWVNVVRDAGDLDKQGLKGVLALEGAHPLQGELANVGHLFDAGYRVMGLQHFFDNDLGGSMHGVSGAGLTAFGRDAVREAARLGMSIDLAHSSEAVARDVLAMEDIHVMVSHTGLRSACPRTANRNLPDDVLRQVAQKGGVVGIAYFDGAVCDISPGGIADTILQAVDVLGEDAVALGSDFDGTVTTSFDASELFLIVDALRARGLSEPRIAKVMGENVERFFRDSLPDDDPEDS